MYILLVITALLHSPYYIPLVIIIPPVISPCHIPLVIS